jgi:hypothetical protein
MFVEWPEEHQSFVHVIWGYANVKASGVNQQAKNFIQVGL